MCCLAIVNIFEYGLCPSIELDQELAGIRYSGNRQDLLLDFLWVILSFISIPILMKDICLNKKPTF